MSWQRPSPRIVWRAIDAYLEVAYAPAQAADPPPAVVPPPAAGARPAAELPPSAVRARLETLRSTPQDAFYDSPVFERQEAPRPPPADPHAGPPRDAAARDLTPVRYALRLGNLSYPHMKFIIERSPDGQGYLLRADTHDAHIQPRAGSREQAAFAELVRQNRTVADAVEGRWEQLGLPTFKKFLRDDLDRRRAAAAAAEAKA
jgi:hypothetical protein